MKKFNITILITASLFLSSCQAYRSNFDCPPGEGVPCTPVTDIERMIIETPDGSPDIFLGYLPNNDQQDCCYSDQKIDGKTCLNSSQKRIWITGKRLNCGTYVEGHFIYLNNREIR